MPGRFLSLGVCCIWRSIPHSSLIRSYPLICLKCGSVNILSIVATFIYEWEMLENRCPSEEERKSEAGLPTGQRCTVGYWLVPGAAVGALKKHIYTNIIDKGRTVLYLSKVDRYFIILWEEIPFSRSIPEKLWTHSNGGLQEGSCWCQKGQFFTECT